MMRILSFLGILCLWGSFSALAAASVPYDAPLNPDSLVLLSVTSDGVVLSEGIEAYQTQTDLLVPLSGLSQILGLAITSRPDLGYAEGWYFQEDQKFALNFFEKTVTLSGKSETFQGVKRFEDDFYVPLADFSRWFGVKSTVNFLAQELRVTSETPLPTLLAIQRGKKLQRANTIPALNYPRVEPELPFISAPYSDITVSNLYDSENDPEYQTNVSALSSFKAHDFNVQNFVSAATDDGFTDFRLTLDQKDEDGNLLGPLRARQLALGDIYTPTVSSIAQSDAGAGVQVSNFPINRINNFGRTTLRGNIPPGWDVELYRNGALLDTTRSQSNGTYEFVDVPLLGGTNVIRLVFYGPFGEIREETKQFIIGADLIQKGAFQYGLNATRQSEDLVPIDEAEQTGQGEPRFIGEASYGLTQDIALLAQAASLTLEDDDRHDYVGTGAAFSVGGAFVRSLYIDETSGDGGYALDNRMQTAIQDVNILAEWQEFKDDFVSEDTESINNPLDRRLHGSLDRYVTMPDSWPALNLGLDAEQRVFDNSLKEWEITQRTSTFFGRNSITHELKYVNNNDPSELDTLTTDNDLNNDGIPDGPVSPLNQDDLSKRWEGVLRTSSLFQTFDVRSQIFYDIDPNTELTALNVTGTYDWSDNIAVQPSITHLTETDDQERETEYGLTVIRDYETFQLSAQTIYNDQGEFRVGLNLSLSIGQDPSKNNTIRAFHDQISTTGMVDAVAFMDRNANNQQDPGEEALPNVAFQIDRAVSEHKTNENGHAFIPSLPVHQPVPIAVDPSSLEDPAFQSALGGQEVILRPGVPAQIRFPIVPTGSIEGTVFLSTKDGAQKAASNVVVQLMKGDKVIMTTRTAYDGYYLFEFVPPGTYTLRLDPDQAKRLGFLASPEKQMIIKDENSTFGGVDWVLGRG